MEKTVGHDWVLTGSDSLAKHNFDYLHDIFISAIPADGAKPVRNRWEGALQPLLTNVPSDLLLHSHAV